MTRCSSRGLRQVPSVAIAKMPGLTSMVLAEYHPRVASAPVVDAPDLAPQPDLLGDPFTVLDDGRWQFGVARAGDTEQG
jgi:hypothetical protein